MGGGMDKGLSGWRELGGIAGVVWGGGGEMDKGLSGWRELGGIAGVVWGGWIRV